MSSLLDSSGTTGWIKILFLCDIHKRKPWEGKGKKHVIQQKKFPIMNFFFQTSL